MSDRRPNESATDDETVSLADDGFWRWFLRSDDDRVVLARDIVSSLALVAAVGLLLFAISGIWPPLVAVESESMEPNMQTNDLVFLVDADRFVGDDPVDGTGVVTLATARETGYEQFDRPGDVIVFRPNGREAETPVIHRAHFWVEAGENWVDSRADPAHLHGATCDAVAACPAPHDGFVTKGDHNGAYDQIANAGAETTVVRPDWVVGKAAFRIPWIGRVRLAFESLFAASISSGASPLA